MRRYNVNPDLCVEQSPVRAQSSVDVNMLEFLFTSIEAPVHINYASGNNLAAECCNCGSVVEDRNEGYYPCSKACPWFVVVQNNGLLNPLVMGQYSTERAGYADHALHA
jgi:hypothetical protein